MPHHKTLTLIASPSKEQPVHSEDTKHRCPTSRGSYTSDTSVDFPSA